MNKYKSHPWHGITPGEQAPTEVNAFIEIVPSDTVKYEIDKESGYLKVDRPQRFSNVVPALYGFIPQTYCGKTIAKFATDKSGKDVKKGDGDPLDICVLTRESIAHGDIILKAIPIGGLRLIDKGEADDKIIAILKGDPVYETYTDLSKCPDSLIARLKHYFLTYKNMPGDAERVCEIAGVYGRQEAMEVINCAIADYKNDLKL